MPALPTESIAALVVPVSAVSSLLPSDISPGTGLPPVLVLTLVAAVALVAGAINSIAGGGTLVTFPALVALGISPIVANATNSIALWPASFASFWGYRRELSGARTWAIGFAAPSVVGGLVGALLLLWTPSGVFDAIVPWLVFAATALFLAQGPLSRRAGRRRDAHLQIAGEEGPEAAPPASREAVDAALTRERPTNAVIGFQFLVSIYGGYFGASRGILMLAALGLMGLSNIHRMNGLKNWGSFCMAASAALTFMFSDLVSWPVAGAMTVGSMIGGYGGALLAQRVSQAAVRRAIVLIGVGTGIWMLMR